jgi:hypothetical protein
MAERVRLEHTTRRVTIPEMSIDDPLVFDFFDNQPESARNDLFIRALRIGVHALMEDRIGSFLSKTENQLGLELENLKRLFDDKAKVWQRSTAKGFLGEEIVKDELEEYIKGRKLKDVVRDASLEGGALDDGSNKTGDLIVDVAGTDRRIVIEVKFDKQVALGPIHVKEVFQKRSDTAWSQMLEAAANRSADEAIIVFDAASLDGSISKEVGDILYIPGVGIACVVDVLGGDFRALMLAYALARSLAVSGRNASVAEVDALLIVVSRIVKEVGRALAVSKHIEASIKSSIAALEDLNKSLILLEAAHEVLQEVGSDGQITAETLYRLYRGKGEQDKYLSVEAELREIETKLREGGDGT